MRQRLLQRQSLLEHVALQDALEQLGSQLPAGLRSTSGEADQRGLARLVVLDDFLDPTAMVEEGITVSRQHGFDLEPADAVQRSDVVVQRIRAGLWVQADVRADLWQQVVPGQQHTTGRPVEAAVARRV